MILKGMDRNTMLKCRLINSDWKAVVDSLLEKAILSNWQIWNATDPFDKDLFQIMPIVQAVNEEGWMDMNYVYRHDAIKQDTSEDGYNPFLFKSLQQQTRSRYPSMLHYNSWKALEGLDQMEMHLFLIEYGHHLTSLALHQTKMNPPELFQISNHLPNLKALTLIRIVLAWTTSTDDILQFFRENQLVNALPALTHLRVQTGHNDQGLLQWLLDCCAGHLVRLEFDAGITTPITDDGISWVLEKLEKLTIRQYHGNFLKSNLSLPFLKCLSINLTGGKGENVSILKFMKQFPTLEVLNLGPDITLDELGEKVEWEADRTIFQR